MAERPVCRKEVLVWWEPPPSVPHCSSVEASLGKVRVLVPTPRPSGGQGCSDSRVTGGSWWTSWARAMVGGRLVEHG